MDDQDVLIKIETALSVLDYAACEVDGGTYCNGEDNDRPRVSLNHLLVAVRVAFQAHLLQQNQRGTLH